MKQSLLKPDKIKSDLEQGRIMSIDKLNGRVSVSLRNGLISAASSSRDVGACWQSQ
jgi:hypothetical protein